MSTFPVTINIGLGKPTYSVLRLTTDQARAGALAWVTANMDECYIEWHAYRYAEPLLAVNGMLKVREHGFTVGAFKLRFENLAYAANQDCVAVLSDLTGGQLYGMFAKEWGAFDHMKFVHPTRRPF